MSTAQPNLRYSLGSWSLAGRPMLFLVATTEAGVCALLLGEPGQDAALLQGPAQDLVQGLVQDLAQRFPRHSLSLETGGHAAVEPQVRSLLEDTRPTLDLPLVPEGTVFQRGVWQALQAIPAGGTLTYTQLASRLGLPTTAVRAIAGACAANPLAVAIPCHRVVRGDGSLAGYRWGLATKRALLQREADQASTVSAFVLTA